MISRIGQQYYVYSAEQLLAFQVDAAVNNANKLVGIAMMKNTKAENTAYIVPTVIINTFLEDIKDGTVNGFYKEKTYYGHL